MIIFTFSEEMTDWMEEDLLLVKQNKKKTIRNQKFWAFCKIDDWNKRGTMSLILIF